jgi:hypothetical protein
MDSPQLSAGNEAAWLDAIEEAGGDGALLHADFEDFHFDLSQNWDIVDFKANAGSYKARLLKEWRRQGKSSDSVKFWSRILSLNCEGRTRWRTLRS